MSATGTSLGPGDLPELFGRYRIKRRLARGGMGTVYLAHDTLLDREVALKVPLVDADDRGEWLARFYREARAAAALRHPNLCPVYDVGEINGTPYLTMAYIEGHSLAHLGGRAHSAKHSAAIVRKIAFGLAEAHRHGVLHRDLKPANIMIDKHHEPIVMDFGLARRGDADDARLTHKGTMLGTPAYMPPEQVLGNVDAMGPACDIYSLGVILYELLCGVPPFEGPTAVVLGQILNTQPVPPSQRHAGVDTKLEAICLKAMAKRPDRRYTSMDLFAAMLSDYLRAAPSSHAGSSATVTPRTAPPARLPPGAPTMLPQPVAGSLLQPSLAGLGGAGTTATGASQVTPVDLPCGAPWRRWRWQFLTVLSSAVAILMGGLLLMSAQSEPKAAGGDGQASNVSRAPPEAQAPTPPPAMPALHVSAGPKISLRPGEHAMLDVRVDRQGCSGEVELRWSGLPRSVAGNGAIVPAGEKETQLELIAADDAKPVAAKAIVLASLKSLQATTDVQVIIEPPQAPDKGRSARPAPPNDLPPNNMPPSKKPPSEQRGGPAPPPGAAAGAKPPDAAQQAARAKPSTSLKLTTNSIGMKLVLVPRGQFMMGSDESMMDLKLAFGALPTRLEFTNANEQPRHPVRITQDFYLGMHEVTRDQFAKFVEAQGFVTDAEKQPNGGWGWQDDARDFVQQPQYNWRNPGFGQDGGHPVVNVSWNDAVAFCTWLSAQEGKQYRLPSEAEWEYACRAGTTTRFYNGDNSLSLVDIGNVADRSAQERLGTLSFVFARDGFAFTAPVGHFRPNVFGLYDMTGNVWEWCADWYDDSYYASSPTDDPPGPAAGLARVARGGSFNDPAVYQRSARRACLPQPDFYCGHGFRVLCEAGPAK